jgi:hypothetical protein
MPDQSVSASSAPDSKVRLAVAELIGLIVGVAIVCSLPWLNRPPLETLRSGFRTLLCYPMVDLLAFLEELLGKAALALVPAILVRSARLRRIVPPLVFLVACLGLPWLASGLHYGMMSAWLRRQGDVDGLHAIPVASFRNWESLTRWVFYMGWLLVAATVLVVLATERSRLPIGVRSGLLMLAWLGAREAVTGEVWRREVLGPTFQLRVLQGVDQITVGALFVYAQHFPVFLLYALPFAAAFATRPRRGVPELLRPVSAVTAFVMTVFVISEVKRVLILFLGSRRADFWISLTIPLVTIPCALAVATALVRRFGPAWRRWFRNDTMDSGKINRPSEA